MQEDLQHPGPTLSDIVRRTAIPFCLFAVVLTGLLTLSWLLLIPQITDVTVGGQSRDVSHLQEYNNQIQGEITLLEHKRGAYLLPIHHEVYERLKVIKNERSQFEDLRKELKRIRNELVPGNSTVVSIASITFDAGKHTADIRGDIRNVGPRSMTVLARFVEAVQAINFVIDVEPSQYTRKEDPTLGFYSPFTLHIRLDRI
ncbi:MAG: hypothetical protein KC680_00785 [Candidatus Peregrinibacteria bacterium]|nr:hypothetical protein [Candidatus Peregrinibacteria bacterium]MCB9808075.1 hypothetical protein [Candidatus Peribacteria bacterium]